MKKNTFLKPLSLLIGLFCVVNFGFGQTTLSAGDIAITGVNSDNPDQFSFVLLTDVLNGTQINFTDEGWLASGSFRGITEGVLTWEATSDLSCGTQITITDLENPFTASIGTVTDSGLFQLASGGGDQILAYQGLSASPTFLYAIDFGNVGGWSDATGTNDSAIPTGLTNGVNAVNIGDIDNGIYDCIVTNDVSLILAPVSDFNNWEGNNTTPLSLGGCTFTCTTPCLTTTTWMAGAWDNGTPDINTNAIIASNYTTTATTNISACSLTVNAGAILTVANSTFVEVENDVNIEGEILVLTQGAFVQNNDAGVFNLVGSGTASVNKQTPPKAQWYYYTYWSSPVVGQTIANAFPDVDGDRRFWFNAANFVDTNGDDIDDNGNDWQYALAADVMQPGVGYASTEARFHFPNASGTATFSGAFNTGDIDVAITSNPANTGINWNFIGNPYPSAVDFVAFQAANASVLDGSIYYWSQATPPSASNPGNQQLNFSLNDYAIYTAGIGGVKAGANSIMPNGFIPSGQGFFISSITDGIATFTNSMRIADGTSNSQFFKNSNSKKKTSSISANKLWIELTSDNGVYNQVLIGYVDEATNNDDGMFYDAPRLPSDVSASLYSTIEGSNKKFAIQGKDVNSLNESETIKLGFKSTVNVATLFTLSISDLQGDFLNSNTIYLKDNLLNKTHNLSASNYTFTSAVGEFNDRFVVTFSNQALAIEDVLLNKNALNIVQLNNEDVQFKTSNNLTIKTVTIFDMLGRQLYSFKAETTQETFKLSNLNNSVFIAKVTLSNGAVITKKAFKK